MVRCRVVRIQLQGTPKGRGGSRPIPVEGQLNRAQTGVGFGEAFVVFAGLALIFSDRLQGLTIAFGLAGAEPPADEGGAR